MKIIAISDTHNAHDKVSIPECDILIHAGDESYKGTKEEIEDFARWFDKQPAKHLIWTPGNHSLDFERAWPKSKKWVSKISPRTHVLLNSDITIEGLKIWGSPVTPWFHDWAWNVFRGEQIRKVWSSIPADAAIVVTHGPPHGVLDIANFGTIYAEHVGCKDLMATIKQHKPKLHIFGHIHECNGVVVNDGTIFCNASIMDRNYIPVNQPKEFNLA